MASSPGQPLLPDQTKIEKQNRDLGFGSVMSSRRPRPFAHLLARDAESREQLAETKLRMCRVASDSVPGLGVERAVEAGKHDRSIG